MDRQWMFNPNRFTNEYEVGVNSFLEFARHHVNERNEIKCPCKECQNRFSFSIAEVYLHLMQYGVEDVSTNCKTHKVVVQGEKTDPIKYQEMVLHACPSYTINQLLEFERRGESFK